uniref:RNA-directed DNA polymerase, eukaryota, reverse transcriptase zinc-binding domain protein n=1 Tax=Tanacetum cinerariifolium TaxID=118510 RepID=A0A6L2NFC8_TANCI|nr:hypothetical protein [Tanacetum cinerariifolium]
MRNVHIGTMVTSGVSSGSSATHIQTAEKLVTSSHDEQQHHATCDNATNDQGLHGATDGIMKDNANGTKQSFAAIFKAPTTAKVVRVTEMKNKEVVQGKRLAFPLVENYVKNAWAKFGLKRSMLVNGFFFFQFATKEEVSSKTDQKDSFVVAIPFPNGKGHSLETKFKVVETKSPADVDENDGFTQVTRKRGKGKQEGKEDEDEEVKEVFNKEESWKSKDNMGASTPFNKVIFKNNLCVNAILESYVANSNLQGLCTKVFKKWQWTSNGLKCTKGSRIILGWNPDVVNVVVISFDAQVMHICIYFKADKMEVLVSFGGFNVSLFVDEKSTGSSFIDTGMRDFQDYVDALEMSDVNSTGLRFTWNQKPKGDNGVLKKTDRIMANIEFYTSFVGSSAIFQPYQISDHSLAVLRVPMISRIKPCPFKFSNILIALDKDLDNIDLREEAAYLLAFNDASLLEEKFLMQKAKAEWLKSGDSKLDYFHKVVKSQATRNQIDSITITHGINVDRDQVPLAFIDHYSKFLGHQGANSNLNTTIFSILNSLMMSLLIWCGRFQIRKSRMLYLLWVKIDL